jgi:hypothetical protein
MEGNIAAGPAGIVSRSWPPMASGTRGVPVNREGGLAAPLASEYRWIRNYQG